MTVLEGRVNGFAHTQRLGSIGLYSGNSSWGGSAIELSRESLTDAPALHFPYRNILNQYRPSIQKPHLQISSSPVKVAAAAESAESAVGPLLDRVIFGCIWTAITTRPRSNSGDTSATNLSSTVILQSANWQATARRWQLEHGSVPEHLILLCRHAIHLCNVLATGMFCMPRGTFSRIRGPFRLVRLRLGRCYHEVGMHENPETIYKRWD